MIYSNVGLAPSSSRSSAGFTLAGDGLLEDPNFKKEPSLIFLAQEDIRPIIELFYAQGFFKQRSAPSDPAGESSQNRTITLSVEGHERLIRPEGPDDEAFLAMERKLAETFQDQVWQLLYPGGDWRKWWENRYEWWKENRVTRAGTDRFLEDLIAALDLLTDDLLVQGCAWLAQRAHIQESLQMPMAVLLLSELEKRRKVDPVVAAVSRLLTATKNQALFEPMVLYLFGTFNEEAYPLLKEAVLGLDCLETAIKDQRWFVRVVAAKAAGQKGGMGMAGLKSLLDDEVAEVRHAAIQSLVSLNSIESRRLLEGVMDQERHEDKAALLTALAGSSAPWVIDLFETTLQEKAQGLWPLAVQGLSRVRSERSAELIVAYIRRFDPGTPESAMGIKALRDLGGAPARATLLTLLEENKDNPMARELVFYLTELGETLVVPRLWDCLLDRKHRDRALDAMAFLLVADFGNEAWKYRDRWEQHQEKSQAFFLKNALGLPLEKEVGEGVRYEGIQASALVNALLDEEWPVRQAALRILEEGAERSFGSFTKNTSTDEVADVARSWQAWLMGQ
jgi:HEAT repeat protein